MIVTSAPIDPSRYTSIAFAERERQALWPNVWLVAAHRSELAGAGAQVTFDIGADSF
jgi:phenylpropionate dioxygenase-like ring-hydroxylating dioxygenase large terminal subunit